MAKTAFCWYNTAASGRFCPQPAPGVWNVRNTTTAGQQLALRTVAVQVAVVGALAACFLPLGGRSAAAVLLGGIAILVSSWTAARVTFTGRAQSAESALLRLIAGMLLKWFVVIAVLLLGTLSLKLAPLYVLIGLVVGLLAQFLVAMKR